MAEPADYPVFTTSIVEPVETDCPRCERPVAHGDVVHILEPSRRLVHATCWAKVGPKVGEMAGRQHSPGRAGPAPKARSAGAGRVSARLVPARAPTAANASVFPQGERDW